MRPGRRESPAAYGAHDAQPVIITWFVDFNALESRDTPLRGSFNLATLTELGAGVRAVT